MKAMLEMKIFVMVKSEDKRQCVPLLLIYTYTMHFFSFTIICISMSAELGLTPDELVSYLYVL